MCFKKFCNCVPIRGKSKVSTGNDKSIQPSAQSEPSSQNNSRRLAQAHRSAVRPSPVTSQLQNTRPAVEGSGARQGPHDLGRSTPNTRLLRAHGRNLTTDTEGKQQFLETEQASSASSSGGRQSTTRERVPMDQSTESSANDSPQSRTTPRQQLPQRQFDARKAHPPRGSPRAVPKEVTMRPSLRLGYRPSATDLLALNPDSKERVEHRSSSIGAHTIPPILRSAMKDHLNHDDYTVAWIAVLPIEAEAALGMLDKRHNGQFESVRSDDYIYIGGEINGHNIVVATWPTGQNYGVCLAATLVNQVKARFSNLWFALLVGVAAGLPNLSPIDPTWRRDI